MCTDVPHGCEHSLVLDYPQKYTKNWTVKRGPRWTSLFFHFASMGDEGIVSHVPRHERVGRKACGWYDMIVRELVSILYDLNAERWTSAWSNDRTRSGSPSVESFFFANNLSTRETTCPKVLHVSSEGVTYCDRSRVSCVTRFHESRVFDFALPVIAPEDNLSG